MTNALQQATAHQNVLLSSPIFRQYEAIGGRGNCRRASHNPQEPLLQPEGMSTPARSATCNRQQAFAKGCKESSSELRVKRGFGWREKGDLAVQLTFRSTRLVQRKQLWAQGEERSW